MAPGFNAANAASAALTPPLLPHSTSSSAGGSLTIVISTSASLAASFGDFASFAPAATNSSARDAVRFHTITACPAFTKFIAIGRPIRPSPINPIYAFAPDSTTPPRQYFFVSIVADEDEQNVISRKSQSRDIANHRNSDQDVRL